MHLDAFIRICSRRIELFDRYPTLKIAMLSIKTLGRHPKLALEWKYLGIQTAPSFLVSDAAPRPFLDSNDDRVNSAGRVIPIVAFV